jgi:hypothetical protein
VEGGGGSLNVSGVSRNRGGFVKCAAIQKRLGIPDLDAFGMIVISFRLNHYYRYHLHLYIPHTLYFDQKIFIFYQLKKERQLINMFLFPPDYYYFIFIIIIMFKTLISGKLYGSLFDPPRSPSPHSKSVSVRREADRSNSI